MPKRKAQTAVPAVPKASLGARIKKDIIKNYQLYLLMIPGFLLLILFKIGPVGAMVIAFEDFSAAKGVFGSTWVGLENFKRILQDPYLENHQKYNRSGVPVRGGCIPHPDYIFAFPKRSSYQVGAQYGTVFEFPAVFHLGSRYGQYHVYAALPYIGSDQYPDHQAGRYFHKLYGKTGMVPAIVRDTGDLADVRLLGHYLYCCHDEH